MILNKINLNPTVVKKKAFIHTPEHLPALHQLVLISGARGSGKTFCCTNLIRFYKKEGLVDRCIIVSPTGLSNKVFYEDLINSDDDIISDMTNSSIQKIIEIIEQEAEEYNQYKKQKELYTLWLKYEKKKIDIDKIPQDILIEFLQHDIFDMPEPPKWKYKDDSRPPIIHVMFDDIQGSPIMKSSGQIISLCIKHRHLSGIGCTIYLLTQSYISISSCPRPIRENAQTVILFRVRDEKLKEQICREATPAQFTQEQFMEAFNFATDDVHNFLMIDYNSKRDKIFRKNFNLYIAFPQE